MKYAARADANQPAIVALLRKAGARVQHLHAVGHGVPDLVVGYAGRLAWVEIKDPAQPPSKRRLTPDEKAWHALWHAYPVYVIESDEDALAMLEELRAYAKGASQRWPIGNP